MTSDAALTSPETADAQPRQAVLSALPPMPQPPRLVRSPEALEACERAMRQRPDPWGSFWVGQPLQPAWEAAARHAEAEPRVQHGPTPLTNAGKVKGRVRTAPGDTVPVWVP